MEHIRCLILGSGPAGYTAAIYAGRANLSPVVYEGIQPGGQLTTTTEVENFPGYPEGVDGFQLMEDLRRQAERFGAEVRENIAVRTDLSTAPYHVWFDNDTEVTADTIIIATGATAKYLGLADEEKYRGAGVSACATCLLPQEDSGCGRRRRHRLRGGLLSCRSRLKGISHCPQAVPARYEDYAGPRAQQPED